MAPPIRVEGNETAEGGKFVIRGELFPVADSTLSAWGTSSREPEAYKPGDTADLGDGVSLSVDDRGKYVLSGPKSFADQRLPRIFTTAATPPEFTFDNYRNVLFSSTAAAGVGQSFINTLTVSIPATIIPILIAAFAAYALAWMEFPGRALLVAAVVGLLVVPLQLALIPLLTLHNQIGIGKGYLGI
ncbi:MAG: carbohydrate ABC transporter permease, partial [Nitratireductor sp.]|nr:carbohydrate ABC transporter permease [Nitratireductor sp.]